MKIMTVIGARPQFIKAAVVSRAFASHYTDIEEIIVHTGQHYDSNMSDVFFDELQIPKPTFNLGIGGGSHGQNTGRMIEKLESLMIKIRPSRVLVYGDTDSTLAAAISASKLNIPIAHVEAGLRSFNKRMPEEINRILTDHVADLLFAPTAIGRENLLKEGVDVDKIKLVGDVMFDAALYYREKARLPNLPNEMHLGLNEFALCTIHRAENTDNPERLRGIFRGLNESEQLIVLPLHPRTRKKIAELRIQLSKNIVIIEPVGYLEMVWLEAHCKFVVTDSGGVQKEAYFFKKLCKTLREETEWLELVNSGWNTLVGANSQRIKQSFSDLRLPSKNEHFYGDGQSAIKIAGTIADV